MSSTPFLAEIVTASGTVVSGLFTCVTAKSDIGEFGVMAGHEPLMAKLVDGQVVLHAETDVQMYTVMGAILRVDTKGVTILCEQATLHPII